jgi:hypothetical protein
LKNINTPNFGSVFRHSSLFPLGIHKVFLRENASTDEKCPLIGHIAVFQTALATLFFTQSSRFAGKIFPKADFG